MRAGCGDFARPGLLEQEGHRDQAGYDHGRPPEGVDVGKQGGLLLDESHDLTIGLVHGGHRAGAGLGHVGGAAVHQLVELRIGGRSVGDEVGLVDLALAGQERRQHGNAHAATEVADEVANAGDLVAHVPGDSDVAEDADRDEDESQAGHLVTAPKDHGPEIDGEAEVGDVVERDRGHGEAAGNHVAGIDFGGQQAGDGEEEDQHEARGRQDFTGLLRGVAHHGLQEERYQNGGAKQGSAEDEVEEHGGGEIAVLEQLQFENGVRMAPLVKDEGDQGHEGDHREYEDVSGAKPVVLLALVEHELEEAEADDDEGEPD